MNITVYGCERDEATAFQVFSPRFGITPALTRDAVTAANAALAFGNQCVSVGHKSAVSASTLLALRESGVRYLSTRSIGLNHIDIKAAKSMGITVGNVTYSPDSVADYTIMLILMALRNAKAIVSSAIQNDFRLDGVRGTELREMTVGVQGAGRIGKAVVERLQGFGCRVLVHDRNQNHTSFETLLRESDILTLHVPLSADTRHMIGYEQISMMKQGAFLINTARGGVVDTSALISALACGRLGGAALDVLEGEEGLFYFDCTQKPIDNQYLLTLQQMPNVIITPHAAYYTGRALQDTVEKTIINCLDFERRQNLA